MHDATQVGRSRSWKWLVCGLLLLATMLNYMDRMTLNILAVRIMNVFGMDEGDYAKVESAFAIAFATGALVMGWLADRVNVRWLYPAALLVWSAAGFATGFVGGFVGLLVCRFVLGAAEAGNWPCALRTTQRILSPEERTMGNSILQSGAALGAVFTPLIILTLLAWTDDWRSPFWVVGALGAFWVGLWFMVVRPSDLALPPRAGPGAEPPSWDWPTPLQVRRFVALMVAVVTINIAWHFFRAWLPLFLQKQHGYTETETATFLTFYYIATDLGSLAAGFATLALARGGVGVHASRLLVFLGCALLSALSVAAAVQPAGPHLLALLLAIGFGTLGLFPCYYSFSQELTTKHQGKVTGTLGFTCWASMAVLHPVVGESVKRTGSYQTGVALAGLAPLIGLAALWLLWGDPKKRS